MKKSNRQYQRGLTTNSYNQDFIYYKYSKQISKSPLFKKHTQSHQQTNLNDHSQIQSLKNTLNTLYEPKSQGFTQGFSKSFNKSVAQLPTDYKRKQQIVKHAQSVYQQSQKNAQLNNKLQMLTSKLRQIAEKPHFTSIDEIKKQKTKRNVCKTNEQQYVNNKNLINKKNQMNQHSKLQQILAKQTQFLFQKPKDNLKKNNFSQQLSKSKSKNSSSFYRQQLSNSNSQSSSLKRQYKNLKNDKSVSTFIYQQNEHFEIQNSQRPRGKTVANIIQAPYYDDDSTKIKINNYLQKKQISNKKRYDLSNNSISQKSYKYALPYNSDVIQLHRGPINSIITNMDEKRFITGSNDYTVKQSTIDGDMNILRRHKGRVNALKMIDNHLFSGGSDCQIRMQKNSFSFKSPVLQIFAHQKQYINVGTSSSIQIFNIVKNVSLKKVDINKKNYKLFSKIDKQLFYMDNHSLMNVDWKVPSPLIELYKQQSYVQDWVSDSFELDFYQIRGNKLIKKNNQTDVVKQYQFSSKVIDAFWKKDKAYFITQNQFLIYQKSKNQLHKKMIYPLNYNSSNISKPCKLQVKNNVWIYGTLDGKLVVNQFH